MQHPDEYDNLITAMYDRIDDAIEGRAANSSREFLHVLKHGIQNAVIYSAYEVSPDCDEGEGLPIDNLDEVPYKGTFRVKGTYYDSWDESEKGETYISEPITDPTWLQLTVLANDCINTTRDFHHAFFETAHKEGKYLRLSFGS
jgi:hypothetical protein